MEGQEYTLASLMASQPHNRGEGPEPVFDEGEKVYAWHQNMLYEAKILRLEFRTKPNSTRLGETEPYYFIHYQGWKNKWDEWVNNSRVVGFTPENKQFQSLMREESARKKRTYRKREVSPSPSPKKQKVEIETVILQAPESVELPLALRKILADDLEQIVHHKNLITLPATYTVSHIFAGFADEKLNQK
jgi:mortality factor 4-like protein 1